MDERAFDRKLDRKATRKEAATKIKQPSGKKQPSGIKQFMETGLDLYRFHTGPPEGKKRAKDLAAKGVKLPDMDETTVKGNVKSAISAGKRKIMGVRAMSNVAKLENNKEFISLLTSIDKTQAKDLMTIAMLEARMDPKAKNEKSGDLGLFQVKSKFFTKERAIKANEVLKNIGSKKRITKHTHLTDPVISLAYELASGKDNKKGVVDKYKLHQQEQAGINRQKITTVAPDSAFMMFHAKGMKKKMDPPNLQNMMSISDVDDALAAIISNVTGNDRSRVDQLQKYIRKMWDTTKKRRNTSAAELDKKTFRAVKRAVELYNKETASHVGYSESASKGDILKRAAAGRTRSKK